MDTYTWNFTKEIYRKINKLILKAVDKLDLSTAFKISISVYFFSLLTLQFMQHFLEGFFIIGPSKATYLRP